MSAPALADPRPRVCIAGLWGLVAVTVALAVAGGVVARGLLVPAPAAPLAGGPFAVAQDVPVSFGWIAVEHARKIGGISKRAVAGADHGIPGFVGTDQAQLEATLTLRNTTHEPVAYDAGAFSVLVGGRTIPPTASTLVPGKLEPGAAIDATVRFTVPARREHLRIAFDDPGRRAPAVVDLGRLRTGRRPSDRIRNPAPPPDRGGHDHAAHG